MILFPASYLRQIEEFSRAKDDIISVAISEFDSCEYPQELEVLRIKYIGVNGLGKKGIAELKTNEIQERCQEAFERALERLRPLKHAVFEDRSIVALVQFGK